MTILTHDKIFLGHQTGPHPESGARLDSISAMLERTGLGQKCQAGALMAATQKDVTAVHEVSVWNTARAISESGGGAVDQDTVMSEASFKVALAAAGSLMANVDAVIAGQDKTALSLIRPPGHHAKPKKSMGFCLFNNVAIAAKHALQKHGLHRVLIVDWDVHHGNGTQDVFYGTDQVHFLSIHRFPFYPGTGAASETGEGRGLGATHNVPVAYGTPRLQFLDLFRSALDKAAERCKPELIFISAGFDGHKDDPIGDIGLEAEDFLQLTQAVVDVAEVHAEGRIVSTLEGGYHLKALADCTEAHLRGLLQVKL